MAYLSKAHQLKSLLPFGCFGPLVIYVVVVEYTRIQMKCNEINNKKFTTADLHFLTLLSSFGFRG
jgi:hypothetical protein